jgi:hypothetical protein
MNENNFVGTTRRPMACSRLKQTLSLVATLATALSRAADVTTTIGFDNLSPFPPPPDWIYVTGQYDAQGIHFDVDNPNGATAPRVRYVGSTAANSGAWVV